jgi:hypothetical protein
VDRPRARPRDLRSDAAPNDGTYALEHRASGADRHAGTMAARDTTPVLDNLGQRSNSATRCATAGRREYEWKSILVLPAQSACEGSGQHQLRPTFENRARYRSHPASDQPACPVHDVAHGVVSVCAVTPRAARPERHFRVRRYSALALSRPRYSSNATAINALRLSRFLSAYLSAASNSASSPGRT